MALLYSVLGSSATFIVFSLLALVATLVVGIGLYLEYERYEEPSKRLGNLLVIAGVVCEALFGLFAFTSATVRESRSELEIAQLALSANQLAKDAETARGQIASANERAANAQRKAAQVELEAVRIEERLAWRHIDAEEADVFDMDAGAALAGHKVILSASSDPEAGTFASDIDAALTMAHAKVKRVFRLDRGNLPPGVNCLATKGRASERDALVIAHSLKVMAPPYPCEIIYRSPTDLGPVEINVGGKPEDQ
ncbi:MAG: hypothetical protein WA624_03195 [Methylocella sp.]